MLEHTALVNDERAARERMGYAVHTENQNLFRLRGDTATIAGKPGLIAEKHYEVVVTDAKTGSPSPSHRAQDMIYQYAVPKTFEQYQGRYVNCCCWFHPQRLLGKVRGQSGQKPGQHSRRASFDRFGRFSRGPRGSGRAVCELGSHLFSKPPNPTWRWRPRPHREPAVAVRPLQPG